MQFFYILPRIPRSNVLSSKLVHCFLSMFLMLVQFQNSHSLGLWAILLLIRPRPLLRVLRSSLHWKWPNHFKLFLLLRVWRTYVVFMLISPNSPHSWKINKMLNGTRWNRKSASSPRNNSILNRRRWLVVTVNFLVVIAHSLVPRATWEEEKLGTRLHSTVLEAVPGLIPSNDDQLFPFIFASYIKHVFLYTSRHYTKINTRWLLLVSYEVQLKICLRNLQYKPRGVSQLVTKAWFMAKSTMLSATADGNKLQ